MFLMQMLMGNMFFCVTAPLGVGLGLGISEMQASTTTAAISGTLQGIACGTFLYVTFFEVLQLSNVLDLFVYIKFHKLCGNFVHFCKYSLIIRKVEV